jgi:hypothetical protein
MKLGGRPLKPPKLMGGLPGDDQGLLMECLLADFKIQGRLCAIGPAGNADLAPSTGIGDPQGLYRRCAVTLDFSSWTNSGAMNAYLSGISRHMTRARLREV